MVSLNVDSKPIYQEVVQAGDGAGGRIKKGQVIRITDLEGKQVADFSSFMADDPRVHCDVIYSMFNAESWRLKEGDVLVNKHMEPMWTIISDDSGIHHSGSGFCSRDLNRLTGFDGDGCRDILENQLARFDLPPDILQSSSCWTAFMNFPYADDGSFRIQEPNTKPGDKIELRAEADILWVVAVCPSPTTACNGYAPTPMKFEIFDNS